MGGLAEPAEHEAGDVRRWNVATVTEWLAGELNPLGWVLVVEGSGWSKRKYEERMTAVVRPVLVAEA